MERDALWLLNLGDRVDLLDPGSPTIPFVFRKKCSTVEFSPHECSSDGWIFRALKTPAIVSSIQ